MPRTKFSITYYTSAEAAKRIGRSKRTVLEHIYQKRIKDVSKNDIGEREWVDRDIERFLKYFRAFSLQLKAQRSKKETS